MNDGADTTPSTVGDHPFEARQAMGSTEASWWELCLHCGLAESAHTETTVQRP